MYETPSHTTAIIVLNVLAGLATEEFVRPDYVTSGIDVNGDNGIGIEEVIVIFQVTAGQRPQP